MQLLGHNHSICYAAYFPSRYEQSPYQRQDETHCEKQYWLCCFFTVELEIRRSQMNGSQTSLL